ncbi:MAG TPA: preprotein translocase subunit SecE [Pseudomonadales bacterium]|jgi:preprotein translocase subunit SecE|nr:preprotein translocase subunit SecE [Pseudomonadales bacterium]HNI36862.1 preprotein translocase subunit SecE [Pseudomonadales bacterium]HNN86656.1 preprotein translocase subunit SecE [Pseudomonadales bacterium]
MSSKTEERNAKEQTAQLDGLKWAIVGLMVVGSIYGYYHFAGSYPVVYRALALVPVAALAVYVAVLTTQGRAFFSLLRESVVETRRIVWPTRQEAVQTTLVVMGFVVLMALVLWGLDAAFAKLVSVVIG